MHVIKSFIAGIENRSFSIFTKSNAIFSIFSRNILITPFVATKRSKPYIKLCMYVEYVVGFVIENVQIEYNIYASQLLCVILTKIYS